MPSYLLLVVKEGPGGRLEVAAGLPEDAQARLSVLHRLADGIAVLCHAESEAAGLSHGQAWVKHAKQSYVDGWLHSPV